MATKTLRELWRLEEKEEKYKNILVIGTKWCVILNIQLCYYNYLFMQ